MAGNDPAILLVDDSQTLRRIAAKVLRDLGYRRVYQASDGKEALEHLRARRIDLVISDWNMPGATGLDLLKAVRGDAGLKSLPFIMLTAEGQKENILAAIRADVTQYVTKPFTAEVLARKIGRAMAKSASGGCEEAGS